MIMVPLVALGTAFVLFVMGMMWLYVLMFYDLPKKHGFHNHYSRLLALAVIPNLIAIGNGAAGVFDRLPTWVTTVTVIVLMVNVIHALVRANQLVEQLGYYKLDQPEEKE